MPNYYEISPTDDNLTLRDGKASASFTVRYVGDRTVEARAQAIALKGAKDDWLEVQSPSTRKMEPDQTQNFEASVKVPPGTAPGDYALRLDMVSVDNTDEEYDQGPPVSFKVKESAEPEPDTSGFPWWIVTVVAVVLVLAIGGGTWWAMRASVSVEEWTGEYSGRLDGRNASLGIAAEGDTLKLTQTDKDRGATDKGQAKYTGGDKAHILENPFDSDGEVMILHRHNTNLISMRGKWEGVSFGRVFSKSGFERVAGRNFEPDRWREFWRGTFEGHTDGLSSRLTAEVNDDEVKLTLSVTSPDGVETTYEGSAPMEPDSNRESMHVLEKATLTSKDEEESKTLTIKELLIHTWGSNYMTGIAKTPEGATVGQIFVRDEEIVTTFRGEIERPQLNNSGD